jgi:hypothetical protein
MPYGAATVGFLGMTSGLLRTPLRRNDLFTRRRRLDFILEPLRQDSRYRSFLRRQRGGSQNLVAAGFADRSPLFRRLDNFTGFVNIKIHNLECAETTDQNARASASASGTRSGPRREIDPPKESVFGQSLMDSPNSEAKLKRSVRPNPHAYRKRPTSLSPSEPIEIDNPPIPVGCGSLLLGFSPVTGRPSFGGSFQGSKTSLKKSCAIDRMRDMVTDSK